MSKAKRIIGLVYASFLLAGFVFVVSTGPVQALTMPTQIVADAKSDACAGIGLTGGDGCGSNTGANGQIDNTLSNIVNVISVIVGVAAIIMIIIAGLRFITASGDANGVSKAKSTIIYALVGLLIVAMAQFIVHFVLQTAGYNG